MSRHYKSESVATDTIMHRRWYRNDRGSSGRDTKRIHREVRGYVYRLAARGQVITVDMVAVLLGNDHDIARHELSALAKENRALRPFIDLGEAA